MNRKEALAELRKLTNYTVSAGAVDWHYGADLSRKERVFQVTAFTDETNCLTMTSRKSYEDAIKQVQTEFHKGNY